MVAGVAERGYEATAVADLVEISGVSSRTFYDLFPDKRSCFLATLSAIIELGLGYAKERLQKPGSWMERTRRGFDSFAEMIVAHPAAARMCLVDAYAAGPEALARVTEVMGGFETLSAQRMAESTELAAMPKAMISAQIGALQEIARTRLRRDGEAELPELMDALWHLMFLYRPPPEPLSMTGRSPRPRPESLDTRDNADRAMRAFTAVVAAEGYANATVEQAVNHASMSATTFYAYFRNKEDVLMAVIDSAGAQMVAAAMPAARRASDWPRAVRAGLEALFNFLASRPALARLMLMEVYVAGPGAMEGRANALKSLGHSLTLNSRLTSNNLELTTEMIEGCILTLAYQRIRDLGPEALPGLVPICTYIALTPFVGAEQAFIVAKGDRRERRGPRLHNR